MEKISSECLARERELASRFTSDGGTLIFLHIPKTGGKSFRMILLQEAKKKDIRVVSYNVSVFNDADLLSRARIWRAHSFYGFHEWLHQPYIYITLLRDPIGRVIAAYYWLRLHKGVWNRPQSKQCRTMGLREWVESEEAQPYISNLMTKLLSGSYTEHEEMGAFIGERRCKCGEGHANILEAAKKHLREDFIFDFTSCFERGYERFCELFDWHYGPHTNANVMKHLYPKRSEIDPKAIRAIQERNEMDIALMEYAAKILYVGKT